MYLYCHFNFAIFTSLSHWAILKPNFNLHIFLSMKLRTDWIGCFNRKWSKTNTNLKWFRRKNAKMNWIRVNLNKMKDFDSLDVAAYSWKEWSVAFIFEHLSTLKVMMVRVGGIESSSLIFHFKILLWTKWKQIYITDGRDRIHPIIIDNPYIAYPWTANVHLNMGFQSKRKCNRQ